MPPKNPYLDFVVEQLMPIGHITTRAMFGGFTLYCDEVVFALIANNALYLKADPVNRPAFEARGLRAFRPFEDQDTVMQYYEAPPEIFEDLEAMKDWVGNSVAAGRRAQEKRGTRKRRVSGSGKR